MRIFLVRHGLSIANQDLSVHHKMPDHAIPLAEEGKQQALKAKEVIENYFAREFRNNDKFPGQITLWQSPYLRARQTADIISQAKCLDVKLIQRVKENICLCEQKFGLFDGLSDDELKIKFPEEYRHYDLAEQFGGKFWARIPLGESRYDVALRVHQIFDNWKKDKEKRGINDIIVVSHGVTIRSIVMRWFDYPFEWFEQEPNPGNCSVRLLDDEKDYGYIFPGFDRHGKLKTYE